MAIMTVPETAVGKQHCPVLWKHQVRLAREVGRVEPKPEASTMQAVAQLQFWLSVFPADAGHHPAPHFRRDYISHWQSRAPAQVPQVGDQDARLP